jgi:hypothetical protein
VIFVLVHSPLTGPLVWDPAAEELARRGFAATVPEVADHPSGTAPFWQQHASSVARSLRRLEADDLLLVAHSGAGQLLPAIREAAGRPVRGYVFVDAGIPEDGLSRLEQIRQESPEDAEEFERHLRAGERFPEWTDEELADLIPIAGLRRGVIESLRPRPLQFFTEPIAVFDGWPDAPCAYLRLSPAYDAPLRRARDLGWPARSIDAGHFHMLVEPHEVTAAMLELVDAMGAL